MFRFVLGAGAAAYGYDKNGNIGYKLTPGQADVFAHDVAGRMRQVKRNGAAIAQYNYDGDGNRVQIVVGGVTTKFVDGYFEWSGSTSTMVKYYSAAGKRLTMRTGSGIGTTGLLWLAGDHLGSTSVAANPDGSLVANGRQLYKPWGETRAGAAPTPYQYTGQRNETAIRLYFYNARWYDYTIGRFVQADTIIPESQGVQAWDRFAYVNNSPTGNTDPTGHMCSDPEDPTPMCETNSGKLQPGTRNPPPQSYPQGWNTDLSYNEETGEIEGWGVDWGSDGEQEQRAWRATKVWLWLCANGGWWGSGCPPLMELAVWLYEHEAGLLVNNPVYYLYDNNNGEIGNNSERGVRIIVGKIYERLSDGIVTGEDLSYFTSFINPNRGMTFDADDWDRLQTQPSERAYSDLERNWGPQEAGDWWGPNEHQFADLPYRFQIFDTNGNWYLRFGD